MSRSIRFVVMMTCSFILAKIMDNGWIKLHRKVLYNIIWQNDKAFRIWIWCLLKANHQDNEFLLGRQKIQVKRGQFVFGSNKATIELKISKSTIHYWISFLIVERYIERKVTSKYSIITILNYNKYQELERQVEQERDAKRTPSVPIKETNKNDKNVKNEKNNPKGLGKPVYGNPLISKFLKYLKEKTEVIDTPVGQQRNASWILIRKMKSLAKEKVGREPTDDEVMNGLKFLVDTACNDKFHNQRAGNIRYLYNNIGAITKSVQTKQRKIII